MDKTKIGAISRRDFLKAAGALGLVTAGTSGLSLLSGSCRAGTTTPAAQNVTTTEQVDLSYLPTPHVMPAFSAVMDDANSLIFHFRGGTPGPGKVSVQYWADGVGPYTTAPVTANDNSYAAVVARLRPSTTYQYQVYFTPDAGAPVPQDTGSFTTGPLPPGLKNNKVQITKGTPTYDLLLLDYNCTSFNGLAAIDRSGQIVWYFQNDNSMFTADQDDEYHLVFCELSSGVGYRMKEIAPDGRVLHVVADTLQNGAVSAPNGRFNHEMLYRPRGKVWTLGAEVRSVRINGADTLQTGGTIEEWDTARGTVTRLVNLFDILDPVMDRRADSDTKDGFFWVGPQNQYQGIAEDWTHSNSLDVLSDGTVLMSNRHLDQVVAIKPDFSGVAWRLGGPESSFTFANPADQFYHQHYANMLPNNHILLFDNGNLRPAAEGGQYSRGLELELNFDTMQARKVWEYRNSPDLYSSAVGSAVRLANGNTVVDFGVDTAGNSPAVFTVVEADGGGSAVAITKISAPGKLIQYRAIPLDSLNGEKTGAF